MFNSSKSILKKSIQLIDPINRDFNQMLYLLNYSKRKEFVRKFLANLEIRFHSSFTGHSMSFHSKEMVQEDALDENRVNIMLCFSGIKFFVNCIPLFAIGIVVSSVESEALLIINPITGDRISIVDNGPIEFSDNRQVMGVSSSKLKAFGSKYFILLNSILGRFSKPTIEVGNDELLKRAAENPKITGIDWQN